MDAVSESQALLAAARAGDRPGLEAAAAGLAAIRPGAIEGDAARIAFWLNVYNARLLDALDERPLTGSLLRHRGLFRRAAYEVGGERYSLDAIEHGLLRGNARAPFALRRTLRPGDERLNGAPSRPDPRIHFALNCGAASCPPIRAYSAEKLRDELEAAARAYLEAESGFDAATGRLVLPGLLRLYRADFEPEGGAIAFALSRLPFGAEAARADVSWSRFDWTLNGA